ncbi:hypothetical protein [Glaciimonas soli]|uniref:Uncharacterized protein n=1 Tax=Glaciimonas soli TaxID=2590999 RepID=A0A843Z0F5_9BURK|nr:hypothetical protein [Glaciimonas soli]MQR02316.1 hypothetical protein [Glaciimonas soli]
MRNPYKVLLGLLPNPPLMVGTVIAVDGGTVTFQLPGGGITQARGDAIINTQVFIRDGVIEGAAENLPIEIIEL